MIFQRKSLSKPNYLVLHQETQLFYREIESSSLKKFYKVFKLKLQLQIRRFYLFTFPQSLKFLREIEEHSYFPQSKKKFVRRKKFLSEETHLETVSSPIFEF